MIELAKKVENQAMTVVGVVTSTSMNKSAVVATEIKIAHPVYGKFVKKTTKYYVHDEQNQLKVGDTVKIRHSRPLSKLKRWVLVEVISSELV
jgi:small subunit ribosomal protein S17